MKLRELHYFNIIIFKFKQNRIEIVASVSEITGCKLLLYWNDWLSC